MPYTPDAAIFAALVAAAPPPVGATELVLGLTDEVQAVTQLLREATEALRGPASPERVKRLAGLLLAAQEAAQRQAESTALLLRHLSLDSRAA
jgi:hypothetical protein